MRSIAAFVLGFLPLVAKCEEHNSVELLKDAKLNQEKMVAAYRSITSKDTAKSAAATLKRLETDKAKIAKEIKDLPPKQSDDATKRFESDWANGRSDIQKEVVRICKRKDYLDLLELLGDLPTLAEVERSMVADAKLRANRVQAALVTYLSKNDDLPPQELNYVARYLKNKDDLMDPWGVEFLLGSREDKDGKQLYFVFAICPTTGDIINGLPEKKK